MTAQLTIALGAILAMFAVILGAFGAHALKAKLTVDMLTVYQTGVEYHFIHALAVLCLGIMIKVFPSQSGLSICAILLLAGILFFSGSLYCLALTGIKVLGAVTPIGGALFIAGWGYLAYIFAFKAG